MPTEQTNIVPGSILEGKVQGITSFGAFVELPGGVVGLVHISEIADTYVRDVKDFIREGDVVKVKVLNVAGKKIGLSIKQAVEKEPALKEAKSKNQPAAGKGSAETLDEKIAKFLKESDERMQSLKLKHEPRRRNRHYNDR
ncbi:S1 RNA binding domain protein [Thermosyntropha lipolytica DSM 11003]|uniref:S1 RNA binding domain protein n=1 Tax=Thermosyntropha lipolytica DSM 11003 TaxID=1123382 RepID=A0A1M5JT78_9FIRM|nr:S1 RNA-binding domain-containing protein [Thermosyntropha lipolytica]SHG43777.1 S1 RNA binding domain protein [Thermosyntropha lipolytica DSM 11003]